MTNPFDLLIDTYLDNNIGIDAAFMSESLSKGLQENILQLHYKAWNLVIDQRIKIRRLYAKKYIPDDAVQIIKYLCPKEIQLCASSGYFITI